MNQYFETNEETKSTKPKYEWKPLDEVVRRWAVQSQFESDVEKYNQLKNEQ